MCNSFPKVRSKNPEVYYRPPADRDCRNDCDADTYLWDRAIERRVEHIASGKPLSACRIEHRTYFKKHRGFPWRILHFPA